MLSSTIRPDHGGVAEAAARLLRELPDGELAVWDIALAADRAGLAPRETAESVGMLLGAGHLVESAVGLRKAPRSASARSAA